LFRSSPTSRSLPSFRFRTTISSSQGPPGRPTRQRDDYWAEGETHCPGGGSSHMYFISNVPPSKAFPFILSNSSTAALESQYSTIACLFVSYQSRIQPLVRIEITKQPIWERREGARGEDTYEALLHPLNDFTNPNESHILPHS
jgi:hypothetical protein